MMKSRCLCASELWRFHGDDKNTCRGLKGALKIKAARTVETLVNPLHDYTVSNHKNTIIRFYLFIYVSFNDAAGGLKYVSSNDGIINK